MPPRVPILLALAATPHAGVEPPALLLQDATERLGVAFVHEVPVDGSFSYPEIIGAGAALLDVENDGDLDLLLVQGGRIPGTERGAPLRNLLLLNDGAGRFTPAAAGHGADDAGFGMGAYAADYDNDGDDDLYLTNVGPNVLLRNRGDGTFEDVTAEAGVAGDAFSLGAAFFDYDADGRLDLFVADYVEWRPGSDPTCYSSSGARDYCGPSMYRGAPDRLYRNLGDGRFEDVTASAGIVDRDGRGMGVVACDLDGDGLEDVFVANDGQPNQLWRNKGDGTFEEVAGRFGCAVNADGRAEASMGVACEDVDDDGDFDLLLTHLANESHTLYLNEGGFFDDATNRWGIAAWSRPDTGFGLVLADFDDDGADDLFVANGAVMLPARPQRTDLPYAERNRLLMRETPRRFRDVTEVAGPALAPIEMTRGVLRGDLDRDGRLDLVLTNNRGPARVLLGTAAPHGHWIELRVRSRHGGRDAIGAIVELKVGDRTRRRAVRPHDGYLASHDPAVRFGLGAHAAPMEATVRWVGGTVERFGPLAPDARHELREGEGRAP